MKRLLLLPVFALLFACTPARQTINVVPYPNDVTIRNGVYELSDIEDIVYIQNESLAEEAYVIDVTRKGVRVEASGERGYNYAMQTLLQMGSTLPCCHIEDAPRFSYRGLHLDEARHFFGKEAVMKLPLAIAPWKSLN